MGSNPTLRPFISTKVGNMTKYRLVSTNNPHTAGNALIGLVSNFEYDGTIFRFGSLHSSVVLNITVTKREFSIMPAKLEVQTLNTLYIFEAVTESSKTPKQVDDDF